MGRLEVAGWVVEVVVLEARLLGWLELGMMLVLQEARVVAGVE